MAVDFLSGTPSQATLLSFEHALGEIRIPLLVWVSSRPPLLGVVEVGGPWSAKKEGCGSRMM